jgi:hypothetical protein
VCPSTAGLGAGGPRAAQTRVAGGWAGGAWAAARPLAATGAGAPAPARPPRPQRARAACTRVHGPRHVPTGRRRGRVWTRGRRGSRVQGVNTARRRPPAGAPALLTPLVRRRACAGAPRRAPAGWARSAPSLRAPSGACTAPGGTALQVCRGTGPVRGVTVPWPICLGGGGGAHRGCSRQSTLANHWGDGPAAWPPCPVARGLKPAPPPPAGCSGVPPRPRPAPLALGPRAPAGGVGGAADDARPPRRRRARFPPRRPRHRQFRRGVKNTSTASSSPNAPGGSKRPRDLVN